jgi:hypothetical protein
LRFFSDCSKIGKLPPSTAKVGENDILSGNFSAILSQQPENLAQVGENRILRLALPNLEQSPPTLFRRLWLLDSS